MDEQKQSNPRRIEVINNFMAQSTEFIGRQNDILKVKEMLAEPSCRLVSLVGPGGIGKTRLGIEITTQLQNVLENGAFFVPLQGITSVGQIVPAIASGVSCELYGKDDTLTQLKRYLEQKETLILLDNFEHLLDGTNIIVELLDAAKKIKILVTSREVLNLRAEWVWSVTGMRFPDHIDGEIKESDSAVQLFDNYAKRLLPEFSLELEKPHVIRICQLVGGVPLAIELATTWLKSLTSAMIADEIQRNLEFLETNMRDMPERHRSMRAVIDQSWKLLSEQEKNAFKQLSIFRGGFKSEAGDQIVGASRVILSSLVYKSLVSYHTERYHLHELLRQYALQHLDMEGDASERLVQAHASYYIQFLADRLQSYRSKPSVLDEILIEIDNIYLAWESVVSGSMEFEDLPSAIYCLGGILNYCVSRQEGIKIFAPAIEMYRRQGNFPQALPAYSALLTTQSVYHYSLMQLTEAIALLEECQTLLNKYEFRPQAYTGSDPLILLGTVYMFQGNFDYALEYGYEAVANGDKYDDIPNSALANHLLGMTFLALGQLDKAMQFGQLALSQSKQSENLAISAYCSDHLGDTAILAGNPAMGKHYYKEGYRYRQEISEFTNLPLSMSLIGKAELALGNYEEAVEWLNKSISLYTTYDDIANLIVPKSQLALCYGFMNDIEDARDIFLEAIYAAELTQVIPLWLVVMAHIGEFLIQLGDQEKGVKLLSTVVQHPMFNQGRDIPIDIHKRLEDIQGNMPKAQYSIAKQAGIDADFETTIITLEHSVNRAIANASPVKTTVSNKAELYAKGLEPLSDRELEVLGLIATGMTNQDIADQLIVTVGTVKSHTHSIYSKLGVRNRTQALKIANDHNLL